MEVAVTMEALEGPGKERTVMLGELNFESKFPYIELDKYTGRFSMVCRNAQTHKAHPVNPLIASTPEEKRLLSIGECE